MLHSEIQLVSHFDNADYITFRAVVLQNILATDMARHGEYTAKLKRRVDPNTPAEEKGVDKQFEMEILIKCADTSNVLKPFPIAKKMGHASDRRILFAGRQGARTENADYAYV